MIHIKDIQDLSIEDAFLCWESPLRYYRVHVAIGTEIQYIGGCLEVGMTTEQIKDKENFCIHGIPKGMTLRELNEHLTSEHGMEITWLEQSGEILKIQSRRVSNADKASWLLGKEQKES